ncbi:MAG: hypothetical protein R6V32_08880 [Bacteroidales bacterium]
MGFPFSYYFDFLLFKFSILLNQNPFKKTFIVLLSFLPQKKEAKKPTATPYFSAKRATATTASAISSFLRVQKLFVQPCCHALLRKTR